MNATSTSHPFKRALAWLHDRQFEIGAQQRARAMAILNGEKIADDWRYLPKPLSGLTLKLAGLQDGAYQAYWYSPWQGNWLGKEAVTVVEGEVTLKIPDFQGDLSAKVLPAK